MIQKQLAHCEFCCFSLAALMRELLVSAWEGPMRQMISALETVVLAIYLFLLIGTMMGYVVRESFLYALRSDVLLLLIYLRGCSLAARGHS